MLWGYSIILREIIVRNNSEKYQWKILFGEGKIFMKVIFLDIDGVLNSQRLVEKKSNEKIDITAVKLLKNLIDKSGAVVVMSSGRRLWFDDNMTTEDVEAKYLYDILCQYGIDIYGKTPDFSTDKIRTKRTFSDVKAKEILAWLERHCEVDKYVILDDLDLKNDRINANLIQIDGKIGITEDDVKRAMNILN